MTSIQAIPTSTQYTGEIEDHSGRPRGGRPHGANGGGPGGPAELQSKIESGEIDIATFKANVENRFGAEVAASIFGDDGSIDFKKLGDLRREQAAENSNTLVNYNSANKHDSLIDLVT